MAENNRRRNIVIAVVVLLIIVMLLLLLRCQGKKPVVPVSPPPPGTPAATGTPAPAAPVTAVPEPDEVLTPAVVTVPERVNAGAVFSAAWTGPDNRGDYVTIVRKDAADNAAGNHRETKQGSTLELTAPMEPGAHEVRYITGRSRTILGRAAVEVMPIAAALEGPAEVTLGKPFSVAWTGPNNKDDYITIVAKDALDDKYGSYTHTEKGSPLTLTAPTEAGDAELRYISGQGKKVLARRAIKVVMAVVTLSAPAEAVAGTTIEVTWTGPDNAADYITVVAKDLPDGQYGNYTVTSKGSPLTIVLPVVPGDAELRYMTGQGGRVLARRAIKLIAAEVTIKAPAEAIAGTTIDVGWTGPNNPGDYITVVPKELPDGRYGNYTVTTKGSPLGVLMPIMAGDAELRYMTGQGGRVLARRAITINAAPVTLAAAPECAAGADVAITWTGPNNPGDYITVVAKAAADGQYGAYTVTTKGSPLMVKAPKEAGDAEIRYMTGQGGKVLARIAIKVVP